MPLAMGASWGCTVRYSEDPGRPVGRGGAIRHALLNGSIPRDKNLIVHNPDDVIALYTGSFPADVVAAHLAGVAGRGGGDGDDGRRGSGALHRDATQQRARRGSDGLPVRARSPRTSG